MTDIVAEVGVRSTLDEMKRYGARLAVLQQRMDAAEEQVTHRLGLEYRAGRITRDDVIAVLAEVRPHLTTGWTNRWAEQIGFDVLAHARSLESLARYSERNAQNIEGGWEGSCYVADEAVVTPGGRTHYVVSNPRPVKGHAVVYVLYDADLEPLYVGSTGEFPARMKAHLRAGKPARWWRAYLYPDREAAYVAEVEMLKAVMPKMNRRAGR